MGVGRRAGTTGRMGKKKREVAIMPLDGPPFAPILRAMTRTLIRSLCLAVVAGFVSFGLVAQEAADGAAQDMPVLVTIPASEVDLDDLKWVSRPIIVFADSPFDPRFTEQMNLLAERPGALVERDVVVITDSDPDAGSDLRRKLRPRGFMVVLIGKDGGVKLRKPSPWDVRALTRVIDKMPLRQEELRNAREGS